MLQLGARFYWPEVGRFISQDPIGEGGNWYGYAAGNPVTAVDPDGLEWCYGLSLWGPSGVRYAVGATIMWVYYQEMKRNDWRGQDPYYHCLASCKAARCAGADVSFVLGVVREARDELQATGWSNADMGANMAGILGCPLRSCKENCEPLAPPGMPL